MAAADPGLPPPATPQLPLLRAPIHRPSLPSRRIAGSTSSHHRVHLLLPPPSSAASRPLERCGELRLRRRGELHPRRHRGMVQRREPPLSPLPCSVPPARSGSRRSEGEKRSMSSDSSSWGRALVQISPYTFSTIGIAVSIGVSVLGAACEQQPLRLNPAEISKVIAEVCSETTSNANRFNAPSRLTNQTRQPLADVAFSVLIKLVIDI